LRPIALDGVRIEGRTASTQLTLPTPRIQLRGAGQKIVGRESNTQLMA
jgi:hypothetical protein